MCLWSYYTDYWAAAERFTVCFHGGNKKTHYAYMNIFNDFWLKWAASAFYGSLKSLKEKTENFPVLCANEHPGGLVKAAKRKTAPEQKEINRRIDVKTL